jgi:hypothetical protein
MAFCKLNLDFVSFLADSQGEDGSTDDSHYSQDESSEVDCLVEQNLPEEGEPIDLQIMKPKYGFGNQYSDVFKGFSVSCMQIVLHLNKLCNNNQFIFLRRNCLPLSPWILFTS